MDWWVFLFLLWRWCEEDYRICGVIGVMIYFHNVEYPFISCSILYYGQGTYLGEGSYNTSWILVTKSFSGYKEFFVSFRWGGNELQILGICWYFLNSYVYSDSWSLSDG